MILILIIILELIIISYLLMMPENYVYSSSMLRLILSSSSTEEGLHQNVFQLPNAAVNNNENERPLSPSHSRFVSTNQDKQLTRNFIESYQRNSQLNVRLLKSNAQMQEQIYRLNYVLGKQAEDLKIELVKSQECHEALELKLKEAKQYKIKLDTKEETIDAKTIEIQTLDNKNKELHQSIENKERNINNMLDAAEKIIRELDSEIKKHSNSAFEEKQINVEDHFEVNAEVLRQEDENQKPIEQLQAAHQLHQPTQIYEQKMNKIRFMIDELLQIKTMPNSIFLGPGVSSNQSNQNEKKEGQKKIPFFQSIAAFLTGAALVIIFNKVRA